MTRYIPTWKLISWLIIGFMLILSPIIECKRHNIGVRKSIPSVALTTSLIASDVPPAHIELTLESPRPSTPTTSLLPPSTQSSDISLFPAPSSDPPALSFDFPPAPSPSTLPSTNGLQVGFYEGKCFNEAVNVEAIIESQVQAAYENDNSLLPAILRMQFHDCFVQGCDASILISGNSTEKTSGPNLTVRGYELIDALKAAIQEECPGVVSCADILAVATKVIIKLGGGPDYPVQTGRRDGLRFNATDAELTLLGPSSSVKQIIAMFEAKNFTTEEMVVLLGAHTVGIAHCQFYQDRLHPGSGSFDPSMDPNLRQALIPTCPPGQPSEATAFLDQGPGNATTTIDNSFFTQILRQRGILRIDQALAEAPETREFVRQYSLNATLFNMKFAEVMVKLQALDVLTCDEGEIREICSTFN